MDCRTDKYHAVLKKNLGFKLYNVINTKEQTIINSIKIHLKEKIYKPNIVFQAIGLIFIFININLQLKLMNQDILTEILIMKLKDKKHQKKNLIVYLLELILMKKI